MVAPRQKYSDNLTMVLSFNVFAFFFHRILQSGFQCTVPPSFEKCRRPLNNLRTYIRGNFTRLDLLTEHPQRLISSSQASQGKLLTRCFGTLGCSVGVSKVRLQYTARVSGLLSSKHKRSEKFFDSKRLL